MNNDLISRQAAIDALCRIDEYNGLSLKAIRNLPSVPHSLTQQWTPCGEELPKNEEYVWAVYKNSLFPNGKSHHKTLKYDGEMWIDENGYRYLTANVTHWKYRDPLPKPYKEEEKAMEKGGRG